MILHKIEIDRRTEAEEEVIDIPAWWAGLDEAGKAWVINHANADDAERLGLAVDAYVTLLSALLVVRGISWEAYRNDFVRRRLVIFERPAGKGYECRWLYRDPDEGRAEQDDSDLLPRPMQRRQQLHSLAAPSRFLKRFGVERSLVAVAA